MNDYSLWELPDTQLNMILALSQEDLEIYIDNLIEKFYPGTEEDSELYKKLQQSYHSSFVIEKIYRSNLMFQAGFQAIYTRTGLIRNIVNDVYFAEDDLIVH